MTTPAVTLDTTSYDTLFAQSTALYGPHCAYVVCYALGQTTFTYGETHVRDDIASTVDNYSGVSGLLYNLHHGRGAWEEERTR